MPTGRSTRRWSWPTAPSTGSRPGSSRRTSRPRFGRHTSASSPRSTSSSSSSEFRLSGRGNQESVIAAAVGLILIGLLLGLFLGVFGFIVSVVGLVVLVLALVDFGRR